MNEFLMLADRRNSAENQWLRENPIILSLIFGGLGAIALYYGIVGLKTGRTVGKQGNEITGRMAQITSIIRAIIGSAFLAVAIHTLLFGAPPF